MSLDLTAFVLTQNNIRTIAACLDSLSWCENVVVIDSFSTDGTLEVISRYPNVRLYEGAWKEYVWLKGKSLPAETGGKPAGK